MIISVFSFFVITLSFLIYESGDICEEGVIDVYYSESRKWEAYSRSCPYTVTQIDCGDCIHFIGRKNYDYYVKKYTDLNLEAPFSKRNDTDRILKVVD
tara:strand:+ start:17739 stop:18032 length:294 start_codon:yes stop_codon:yes gene_type:complete